MDTTTNKSGGVERRVSARSSVRISVDAGDDDFGAGMIADGFRPQQRQEGLGSGPGSLTSPSTSTLVADGSIHSSNSVQPGSPSGASKTHRPHESLALRHDGAMGSISESRTRSSSMSTDSVQYIHTESPYQGPDGPSHPYQMYTQNVRLARTMSVTTSSTEPMSESSYTGPRGPAHPYGMYTQATAAESGDVPGVGPVPLFHDIPGQYQRRMGPEGEDIADIIGPDGHTEQLPPYTRYPDEAYARKVRDAEDSDGPVTGGATVVRTHALPMSAQAIAGAGGIGLATRNPEFESMDSLDSPRSRHSSRSFSSDGSHHEINTAAADLSEKGKPLKPWQVWMRKKMWGLVPYWAICMTVVVLALMIAILGSVIGTFMAKRYKPGRKGGFRDPNTMPSFTMTYDATPIPTPSDLMPLPTGTFGIPPLTPNRASSTCFNDTTQSQAWSCYFVMSGMSLTVAQNPENEGGEYTVALNCNNSATLINNVYAYGEQPPIVSPSTMELVTDLLEPNRGPAWFRMLPYNKTVILPQHFLSPTGGPTVSRSRIRDLKSIVSRAGRRGVAKPGDKPWVCNWPQTFLEIFIYPQQNSSFPSFSGKPPPPSSSETPPEPTPSTGAPPGQVTDANPSQTSTPGGGYWGSSGPQEHFHPNRDAPPPPPPTPAPSPTPSTPTSPFGPMDTNDNFPPMRPLYPRVYKLEERRVPGAPMPDCTQVEIQEEGPAKTLLDADGNSITIQIVENELPPPRAASKDVQRRSSWEEQNSPLTYRDLNPDLSQCGCIWFLV